VAGGLPASAQSGKPPHPQHKGVIGHGHALSHRHAVLRFRGKFTNPTPLPTVSNPLPLACVSECQTWTMHVRTPRTFLVAVKNHLGSIDDGINLFVTNPKGKQVASADGIGANGQAVIVHHPIPGTYKVQVTVTYAYNAVTKYRGEARIMHGHTWQPDRCHRRNCLLLPRLKSLPADDMHIIGVPPVASTPLGFPFPVNLPTDNSCYDDETAETGATRCLRFTSEVENVGRGQLHLQLPWFANSKHGPKSGFRSGQCKARQLIDRTNGTTKKVKAGPCEFHAAHGHFHYKSFVGYALFKVRHGHTGKLVGRSEKESFCLADDDYAGYGKRRPNGPRAYAGQPGCNLPQTHVKKYPKKGARVSMGLTPGWGDVYTWDTPDQFIDITHTPPGRYDVIIETNPSGLMTVAGPARNCSRTRIHLMKSDVKQLLSRRNVRCPHSF